MTRPGLRLYVSRASLSGCLIAAVVCGGAFLATAEPSTLSLKVIRTFPESVDVQQGIATDGEHIFVQSTKVLAKYDGAGRLIQKSAEREWHHGGIAYHDGHIYAAVSECSRAGTEKHWIVVYDAESLEEVAIHDMSAYFTVCAGGIAYHDGHFYVAESYYDDDHRDYIVEFDEDFQLVAKHRVEFKSPYGIQGLAYLPSVDRFILNSHGKAFYLIDTDFDSESIEYGSAPFALQDVAHFDGGTFVVNDRAGRRVVLTELARDSI